MLGCYEQAARISTLFEDVRGTSHKALHACYAGQHCESLCAYPSDEEREKEREKKMNTVDVFFSPTITNSTTEDEEHGKEMH